MTNMAHVSTAVALYQAGESLYELFDKVLLIDEGQCLYYGAADRAKEYFLNLGFDCPERWTTADFLTSVTDEHERSIRNGWEDRIPRSAVQFAAAFQKSDAFQWNLDDMAEFEKDLELQRRERLANTSKKNKKKNFTLPFHRQVMACTRRQILVVLGDRASLIGKWGGLVFQGLIAGSLFYNMPATSAGAFTRGGVLFIILLFNALLALAETSCIRHRINRCGHSAGADTGSHLRSDHLFHEQPKTHALTVLHLGPHPMDSHHDNVFILPGRGICLQDTRLSNENYRLSDSGSDCVYRLFDPTAKDASL
jgi:hypothetical protein